MGPQHIVAQPIHRLVIYTQMEKVHGPYTTVYTAVYCTRPCTRPVQGRGLYGPYTAMDRARVNSRVHDHVDGRVGLLGMFVAVFPTRTRQCTQPIHSRVHGLYTAVYTSVYTAVYMSVYTAHVHGGVTAVYTLVYTYTYEFAIFLQTVVITFVNNARHHIACHWKIWD